MTYNKEYRLKTNVSSSLKVADGRATYQGNVVPVSCKVKLCHQTFQFSIPFDHTNVSAIFSEGIERILPILPAKFDHHQKSHR